MKQTKPIIHGRDHSPGGADPIPGLDALGGELEWEDVGLPVAPTESIAQTLIAFSFNGPRVVANGTMPWRCPADVRLDLILVDLGTAPAGSGFTVRVRRNGTSVGNVTLAAGAVSGGFAPSPSAIVAGDRFLVDVTAVGSSTPGSDLVVQFYGVWLA